MGEQASTKILRSVLEEALEPHQASAVLFEALSVGGSVPQTREDVLEVVRTGLRKVLTKRLGETEANAIVRKIELELTPKYDDVTTLETPLEELARETARHDDTMSVPVERRPVPVMVVAAGRSFEKKLAIVLGDRAAPFTVSETASWSAKLQPEAPPIVLVDAADFPKIDAAKLHELAHALPITTVCLLWGADLPYGKSFLKRADGGRPWIGLRLKEGIGPVLDLVRSRRHSSRR